MIVIGLVLIVLSLVASAVVVFWGRAKAQAVLRRGQVARERFLAERHLDTVTRQTVEQMLAAVQFAQLRMPVDCRDERVGRQRGDGTGRQ